MGKYNFLYQDYYKTIDLSQWSDKFGGSDTGENAEYYGVTDNSGISGVLDATTGYLVNGAAVYAVPQRSVGINLTEWNWKYVDYIIITIKESIDGAVIAEQTFTESSATNTMAGTFSAGRYYSWRAEPKAGYILGHSTGSGTLLANDLSLVTTDVAPQGLPVKLTLNKTTGIARIYYKLEGGSWQYTTYNTWEINVTCGTTYQLYAVPETGYKLNDDYIQYSENAPYTAEKVATPESWAPTADTLYWILSIQQVDNGVLSVRRTASPIGNGSIGTLTNGAHIYYTDEIRFFGTAPTSGGFDYNIEVVGDQPIIINGTLNSDHTVFTNEWGYEETPNPWYLYYEINLDEYYRYSQDDAEYVETDPTDPHIHTFTPPQSAEYTVYADTQNLQLSIMEGNPQLKTVTITTQTGVTSAYLSEDANATTGSGTRYLAGHTVYGFIVLLEGYQALNSWVLVDGTANTAGAKYRVGSIVVAGSGNTIAVSAATAKTYTTHVEIVTSGTIAVASSGTYNQSLSIDFYSPTNNAHYTYGEGFVIITATAGSETVTLAQYSLRTWTGNTIYFNMNGTYHDNITIILNYTQTVNKYTVTWLNYDSTLLTTTQVEWGVKPAYPQSATAPTRPQSVSSTFTFDHEWGTSQDGTDKIQEANLPVIDNTGDKTYWARFTSTTRQYKHYFGKDPDTNDISLSTTVDNTLRPYLSYYTGTGRETGGTLEVGANIILAASAPGTAQYIYKFQGWKVNGVLYGGTYGTQWTKNVPMYDNSTIIYAYYTRELKTYTVIWKNGSTTLQVDSDVSYGTTPSYRGDTPTKASSATAIYQFSGWSPTVGPVTGPTTYSAQFTEIPAAAITKTINSNLISGSFVSTSSDGSGTRYSLGTPVPTGYSYYLFIKPASGTFLPPAYSNYTTTSDGYYRIASNIPAGANLNTAAYTSILYPFAISFSSHVERITEAGQYVWKERVTATLTWMHNMTALVSASNFFKEGIGGVSLNSVESSGTFTSGSYTSAPAVPYNKTINIWYATTNAKVGTKTITFVGIEYA